MAGRSALTFDGSGLHRYICFDRAMRCIALDLKILDSITVYVAGLTDETHFREWPWLSLGLFAGLFEMVQVEVNVTAYPDKLTGAQICLLSKHELKCRRTDVVECGPEQ
ncbi:hypothetical protein ASG29_06840 [Sphingomonas sp. Leaf412]|nr:hypothetical protein ASG29_06840 [Sphingomonas sp. Leaf412]